MFTKEHYIKIAEVLRDSQDEKGIEFKLCHHMIVQDFVALLEEDNKKFDVEKFLDIVYGKENKK